MKNHLFILILACSINYFSCTATVPQKCMTTFPTNYAEPTSCDTEPPFPFKVITNITVASTVEWNGPKNWSFGVIDLEAISHP